MLRTVRLAPKATASECALAIGSAWSEALVFHICGVRPTIDLRNFYGQMVDAVGEPSYLAENAFLGDREHQRTAEVWMEVRYDPAIRNAYRHSSHPQPLHTDGSYIPSFPNAGLLTCVSQTHEGGETTFLDGGTLLAVLERKSPDLLARLLTTPVPHARSGDRRIAPIIRPSVGGPLLNWNYYCVDTAASPDVLDLRERFFAFLRDEESVADALTVVKLAPGEAVLWKDDRVLHGRHGFAPQHTSERFFWKAAVTIQPEKLTFAASQTIA